jgi:hypothetical protein
VARGGGCLRVEPPPLFGDETLPVRDGRRDQARVGVLDRPREQGQILAEIPSKNMVSGTVSPLLRTAARAGTSKNKEIAELAHCCLANRRNLVSHRRLQLFSKKMAHGGRKRSILGQAWC